MKHLILVSLSAIFLSAASFASSEICVNHSKKIITIYAHYFFYGNEATQTGTRNCVNEINRMFNNGTRIQLNKSGDWLKVVTKVTHSVVTEKKAAQISAGNTSTRYNFVRIDTPPKSSGTDISEHGLNSNFGYFLTENGLGTSTTCTHEFAHGLGLDHIAPLDWRGKGVPPIMAARGTKVDAKYQYDPKAKIGQDGATVNPSFRVVLSREFRDINMGDLNFKWVSQNTECAQQGRIAQRIYRKDGSYYKPSSSTYSW